MKLSVDLTKTLIFALVFVGVVVLIAMGKLDAEYLKYLLAWLIPGPLKLETPMAAAKDSADSGVKQ